MENVLAAFIAIFIILFSVLTLSGSFLSGAVTMRDAWQQMQAQVDSRARTYLSPISARAIQDISTTDLSTFDFVYRNDGSTKLADYAHWDAFVEYTGDGAPTPGQISRLPLDTTGLTIGSYWSVEGRYSLYIDSPVLNHVAEVVEPGVLNPGEVLVIKIKLSPPATSGKTIQVTLSTPNGVSTVTQFTPDAPPVLVNNAGLTAAVVGSSPIDNTLLSTTDIDDTPGSVVYTVTTLPKHGDLSLGSTFTQLAVDNGQLAYNHREDGTDSFSFTVSDGKTIIGPFQFAIGISKPPTMTENIGITAGFEQMVVIEAGSLAASDPDNPSTDLVYTIKTPPAHGTLNLGKSFTQAALNQGLLTYTRTSGGADSFTFTVTDGQTTIGPYTFPIS